MVPFTGEIAQYRRDGVEYAAKVVKFVTPLGKYWEDGHYLTDAGERVELDEMTGLELDANYDEDGNYLKEALM